MSNARLQPCRRPRVILRFGATISLFRTMSTPTVRRGVLSCRTPLLPVPSSTHIPYNHDRHTTLRPDRTTIALAGTISKTEQSRRGRLTDTVASCHPFHGSNQWTPQRSYRGRNGHYLTCSAVNPSSKYRPQSTRQSIDRGRLGVGVGACTSSTYPKARMRRARRQLGLSQQYGGSAARG